MVRVITLVIYHSIEIKMTAVKQSFFPFRDSGGIQTHNLLIRSQMLYSVELRNHFRFAGAKVHTFLRITKLLEDFFLKKCFFTLLYAFYDSFRGIQRGYNPYVS